LPPVVIEAQLIDSCKPPHSWTFGTSLEACTR